MTMTDAMTQVFETPGSVTLRLRIPSGRVLVDTTEEQRTEVELIALGRRGEDTLEQIEVKHDERSGRHVVTVEQRTGFRWGPLSISWGGDVEVRVKCPVGTELDLDSASTDVRADGTYGDVTARTASGDVRLGDVSGKLALRGASGDVSIDSIGTEKASIVTVSGDVEISRADGPLVVRSVSGDIELGATRGAVSITTTSGDVDLRALAAGELRVESVSGDVNVAVARGTKVFIDANSVSGDLKSELAMSDGDAAEGSGDAAEVVPVHVKTVSGDVALVRASVPVS
jgi:DUF4097 and DUF4098 domain-containing protein YvlB